MEYPEELVQRLRPQIVSLPSAIVINDLFRARRSLSAGQLSGLRSGFLLVAKEVRASVAVVEQLEEKRLRFLLDGRPR